MTRLVDSLREVITPAGGLSLVAEIDGQIVGRALFTGSLLDAPERLVDVQVLSLLGQPARLGPDSGQSDPVRVPDLCLD